MSYRIPYNKPFLAGRELEYIAQCVENRHTAGDGVFTKKCQEFMEKRFQAKKVLLTHSCTAALEMAAILSGIDNKSEVIMPSFTFVSSANAFYLRGAKPVFVDIGMDLNIDESKIESEITTQTRAIVPVHYAGVSCKMDEIMNIASKYNLFIIEDAAQGVNAKYRQKYLGTIGDIGTYSFHETKNIISGEGGAILINREEYIERAEIIREKGTDRSKFFRGEVDKYSWVDIGSSFLPSDIIAAFLYAQLENIDTISKKRQLLYSNYKKLLKPLANEGIIQIPIEREECQSNNHLFYIILKDENIREELCNYLKSKSILSIPHYVPLHLSKMGKSLGYKKGDMPVTESLSLRLLRLPFYFDLKIEEQGEIAGLIYDFFKQKNII